MTGSLRRNSPALFAVRLSESVAVVVPTALAWLSARTRWTTWFGVPVDLVAGLLAAVAVVGLLVDWWLTRFAVTKDGLTFRSGLVTRRSVSVGWAEVVSVQVSRSAVCRALGCARVVVGIGSDSRSTVVIEAVEVATAAQIEVAYARSRASAEGTGEARPDEAPAGRTAPFDAAAGGGEPGADLAESPGAGAHSPIYRIGGRDLLALSMTYGQFVLVVPFLVGLYGNVADLYELTDTPLVLPTVDVTTPFLVGLVLVAAAPVAVAFGVAVAWLRFRHFQVHLRDEVFIMSGGLWSAESRQVGQTEVDGLKLEQNPLMRLTGFARLRFVSRQSGDRIGANLLFPAVRLPSVADAMTRVFPEYTRSLAHPPAVASGLRWMLAGVDLLALAAVCWTLRGAPPLRFVVVVLVAALVLLVVTNHCWAAASVDGRTGVLSYRRGFVWVTHYVVPCTSVHAAESWAVSYAVSARSRTAGVVSLAVYDTRPRRLWVPFGAASAAGAPQSGRARVQAAGLVDEILAAAGRP